jgi:superfamily I DNA/RNA helicase
VLAGPGSGKTKTLTTKMARMLSRGRTAEPREAWPASLTTTSARGSWKARLAALGVEPGGRVFVGTVHSFSLTQIVLPYAKVAGLELAGRTSSVATRAERQAALAEAVRPHGGLAPETRRTGSSGSATIAVRS